MGKHKHSKDKLYVLQSELKGNAVKKLKAKSDGYPHMPFNYCCISQSPSTEPYCDENGNLYDKKSVMAKMATEKAEGKTEYTLDINKLIKINFYKQNNEFICPITRKSFNRFSKILINKKTGNAYSSTAITELYKNKNDMFDPLTHEPMSKSDLIVLQNSSRVSKQWDNEDESKDFSNRTDLLRSSHITDNGSVNSVLQEVVKQKEEKEKERLNKNKKELNKKEETNKREEINISSDESEDELKIKCRHYSNTALAQSVTSTVCERIYTNEWLYLSEKEIYDLIYKEVHASKRNCYITLMTNIGVINLELYASIYPQLCHNFLILCKYKYFDNTEIFKLDQEDVSYFGTHKKNYHKAASGFYWRLKLKKNNLRNKIKKIQNNNNDVNILDEYELSEKRKREKREKTEKDVEIKILKIKETLNNIKSDNDSDYDLKYIKYNDNRHIGNNETFGNLYMFKYYNKKYANMFYICLNNDYVDDNICIGRAVGGYDTLKKLRNIHEENSKTSQICQLTETIIYTDPYKDVINQIKRKIKKEEEEKENVNDKKEKDQGVFKILSDEELVENKFDMVGKYIDWDKLENMDESVNKDKKGRRDITHNKKTDLIKKFVQTEPDLKYVTVSSPTIVSSKEKITRMTFDSW